MIVLRNPYRARGPRAWLASAWLLLAASATVPPAAAADAAPEADRMHAELLTADRYPSARACAPCHPRHYREWSISQHAYAQMSPVFNAFSATLHKLTNGTNGDFCMRCHTPVGMNLGEPEVMSNVDRHPSSREGVTCVVCHRLDRAYGKLSGRLALVEGGVTAEVYGPRGDPRELDEAIRLGGLVTDPASAGRQVHGAVEALPQLSTSGFCATCHDVTLANGFRLEEAFSEYKNSPAAKRGVSCQDCHMGKEQGRVLAAPDDPDFARKNYDFGPAARVGSRDTAPRKLTSHVFAGPDHSVLPPELFPLHLDAIKEEHERDDVTAPGHATIRQWVALRKWLKANPEHADTWGTSDDELTADDEDQLPVPFSSFDDRELAREIVDENRVLLALAADKRMEVLRNGYGLGDVVVERTRKGGLRFRVEVENLTDGHGVPTGFDAERVVWLYVRVFDADGKLVKQSGQLDPNGDVLDRHSLYVHNHELELDEELFTLQSRFVTRNLRGGEREQVLSVSHSLTPLPFIRPARRSTVLLGRPGAARKHKRAIKPLGHRWAKYTIDPDQLTKRGPYRAVIQLKSAMVPVNLLNEIKDVGFDYNMSAREIAAELVDGHLVIAEREVVLEPDRERKGRRP